MENKLTIEQLRNYLGTDMYLVFENYPLGEHKRKLELDCGHDFHFYFENGWVKPICYRLSDLNKFIPEWGFVPIDIIRLQTNASHFQYIKRFIYDSEDGSFSLIPFWVAEQLFQWHFWPFGEEYFEKGLVIDKLKHGRAS